MAPIGFLYGAQYARLWLVLGKTRSPRPVTRVWHKEKKGMPDANLYENVSRYAHLTGAITTISRSGPAKLHRITVNDPGATTLTVYDNGTASGTVIAVLDCNNPGTYEYGLNLVGGLTVVLAGTADVTVVYQ